MSAKSGGTRHRGSGNRGRCSQVPAFESFSKAVERQLMSWLLALDRPDTDALRLAEGIELIEDCKRAFQTGRDALLVRAALGERYELLLSSEPWKRPDNVLACPVELIARKTALRMSTMFPASASQIDAAMAPPSARGRK